MSVCFIDTETMGLHLLNHDIWEIAYAFGDEPVQVSEVAHQSYHVEAQALEVNHYHERSTGVIVPGFEETLQERLAHERPTIIGANPEFDKYRLSRRWHWITPWHYRSVDIESLAMSVLGFSEPRGLLTIAQALAERGWNVPEPDHTAAGDVESTRAAYYALISLAETQRAAWSALNG